MARTTFLIDSLSTASDGPDGETGFFAVGTNPGTEVSATVADALGEGGNDESRHLLRAHLAALAARSGLEVFGLSDDAEESLIRAAYEELLERWHPAKFATAEEDVRELVAEIAIRIEHAYRDAALLSLPFGALESTRLDLLDEGEEEAREELARKLGLRRQESKRSIARARDALQRGDVYQAAREFECALELAPGCREAAAGLQLVGERKRAAHSGSLQRILARGRR